MEKLKEEINTILKTKYTNTADLAEYVNVYEDANKVVIEFLKRQHAEEFLKYHSSILRDYDVQIRFANARLPDIEIKQTQPTEIENKKKDVELSTYNETNQVLEEIQEYIFAKHEAIVKVRDTYEIMDSNYVAAMKQIELLVELYHYIDSKIRKLTIKP